MHPNPTPDRTTTTDVLVVGAGPAGLATALAAVRHGARVRVVERRTTVSAVPRATGVGIRTMEIFRTWGVADDVRAGGIDCVPVVRIGRTLTAEPDEIAPLGIPHLRAMLAAGPELPLLCPQDHIEPVLLDEIRRRGGEVSFGTPLTALRRTGNGVRARLGTGEQVHARFVVGADGPRSAVRTAAGIGWTRLGTLGRFDQIVFRPDLATLFDGPPPALAFVTGPDVDGVLAPMGSGRWAYVRRRTGGPPDWNRLLPLATGVPGLRPEDVAATSFTMAADVASAYRSGPVFLAGDAAHRMTPYGGIGMNTAIHDGHELGWRLAWAARGLAGEALLDAYRAEREPVGHANAERTLRDSRDGVDMITRDLGGVYRSPVVSGPGAGPDRAAWPGQRAPHVRLDRRTSTLDLFDGRLTVLAAAGARRWRPAPGRVPVRLVDATALPHADALVRAYRLAPGSAVLVRPDGIVSWRHDGPCRDPRAALATAVATALGHLSRARDEPA